MSNYYEDERPRRKQSTRERRRDDYDDTTYDSRDVKSTTLVRRRDDSVSSVEEVTRDFPPGERGGAYYRETTVRKQGHRPIGRARSFNDYEDDRYEERSSYGRRRRDDDTYVTSSTKRRSRGYDDRRSRRYSSDSYSSRSRTPPRKDRRKSTTEEILKSVGLGGVAGAILGKSHDRSRSRSRDRGGRSRSRGGGRRHSSSSGSRGKRGKSRSKEQVTNAIKAALLAGVTEAVRARKEPGGWGGDKGKRVLTAAVSAGGVDGLISNKRDPNHHGTRDVIGSAIAGLATNRIVNGPRSKSRGRDGSVDGRGRSESRGGLGGLLAGGALAATGKKVYDNARSRSRGRARSRDSSYDSYGSRSPPRRARSQSISAGLAKGLGAVGLGSLANKVDPDVRRDSRRNHDSYYDDRDSRNGGYQNVGSLPRSDPVLDGGARSVSTSRAPPGPPLQIDYGPHHTGDPETDSDSDLGSSSGEEKDLKKGRKKKLITAGLATVATIHAAHNVYQSMEKREIRRKLVKEGDIKPEQARREKNKNRMQDVASVGIAALGIKGAYSEWTEMREHNHEMKEQQEKQNRHREKRAARRRKLSMIEAQRYRDSDYSTSMPNLTPQYPGPQYGDDNPYTAMGPPFHPQQYIPGPPPVQPQQYFSAVPRSDTR